MIGSGCPPPADRPEGRSAWRDRSAAAGEGTSQRSKTSGGSMRWLAVLRRGAGCHRERGCRRRGRSTQVLDVHLTSTDARVDSLQTAGARVSKSPCTPVRSPTEVVGTVHGRAASPRRLGHLPFFFFIVYLVQLRMLREAWPPADIPGCVLTHRNVAPGHNPHHRWPTTTADRRRRQSFTVLLSLRGTHEPAPDYPHRPRAEGSVAEQGAAARGAARRGGVVHSRPVPGQSHALHPELSAPGRRGRRPDRSGLGQ